MKIIIEEPLYVDREGVCKHLGEGSKFLGSWAIKDKDGNWTEQPIDVFHNPNPPEPFTNNLVGFYRRGFIEDSLYVCDATSTLSVHNMPCIVEDDIVYVSKYRHDFIKTPKGCIVDGGRDYLRSNIVNSGIFLSFDQDTGNFIITNTRTHGHILVDIEYRDENDINKQ